VQLRQLRNIDRHPSRLVFGEQLGRRLPGQRLPPRSPIHSLGLGRYRLLRDPGGEKTMANWKRLTSPSGDSVYLNLDVMIGMPAYPGRGWDRLLANVGTHPSSGP
jgi:hypothetical protein